METRPTPWRCIPMLIACAFGVLATTGCKKAPAVKIAANTPADWATLTVQNKGVTFRAPPAWRATPNTERGSYALAIDGVGTNLSLLVEPRVGGMDVDDAPKQVSTLLAKQYPSFKEVSVDVVEIAGSRSSRLVYEITVGGVAMRATQYVLMSDKKVCFVTYTAAVSNYDAHVRDVEQVAASVKMP